MRGGGNTNEITADLKKRMDEILRHHPAVIASFEGEKKETAESIGSLKIGFAAALLLIYSIFAILFRSYGQPLIVMAGDPLLAGGPPWRGHYVMGFPLTILSLFGIVALTGIVVNDSLLLVGVHQSRPARRDADGGGCDPGRPQSVPARILLTSITTVLGVTPLMLERSFQAQFLIPMAVSLAFGLAFATVVTPLVLPLIYLVFDDLRGGLRWLFLGSRRPASATGRNGIRVMARAGPEEQP